MCPTVLTAPHPSWPKADSLRFHSPTSYLLGTDDETRACLCFGSVGYFPHPGAPDTIDEKYFPPGLHISPNNLVGYVAQVESHLYGDQSFPPSLLFATAPGHLLRYTADGPELHFDQSGAAQPFFASSVDAKTVLYEIQPGTLQRFTWDGNGTITVSNVCAPNSLSIIEVKPNGTIVEHRHYAQELFSLDCIEPNDELLRRIMLRRFEGLSALEEAFIPWNGDNDVQQVAGNGHGYVHLCRHAARGLSRKQRSSALEAMNRRIMAG